MTRLEGWPYSVAEVVAHMLFWQRHDHETIQTGSEPDVPAGADWPAVAEDDWPRLKDEFLASLEKSREIARDPEIFASSWAASLPSASGWFGSPVTTPITSAGRADAPHSGRVAPARRRRPHMSPPAATLELR